MSTILDYVILDYMKLQQEAEEKYGKRTVVLCQVGSFYEVYSYNVDYCTTREQMIDKNGNEWPKSIGNAKKIRKILNCVLV